MKFSSQKKAVASVVAASIMLGLVLIALSSNSSSSQVWIFFVLVSSLRLLERALLFSCPLGAGCGAVWPAFFYGGTAPFLVAIYATSSVCSYCQTHALGPHCACF